MATESSMREAGAREFGTWLEAGGRPRKELSQAGFSRDGGIWGGPTEGAWTKRLLRGAPPPQESTRVGLGALVAHG